MRPNLTAEVREGSCGLRRLRFSLFVCLSALLDCLIALPARGSEIESTYCFRRIESASFFSPSLPYLSSSPGFGFPGVEAWFGFLFFPFGWCFWALIHTYTLTSRYLHTFEYIHTYLHTYIHTYTHTPGRLFCGPC